MASTDFLDSQRKQIDARLQELRSFYEEYLTLERAQKALEQVGDAIPGAPTRRRGPGRPPGRSTARRSATRRRAGNTRGDQAFAVITQNPGITIPDIAKQLGIRQNYLYRVMAKLQQDKRVRRRNRGYFAA